MSIEESQISSAQPFSLTGVPELASACETLSSSPSSPCSSSSYEEASESDFSALSSSDPDGARILYFLLGSVLISLLLTANLDSCVLLPFSFFSCLVFSSSLGRG